MPRNPTMKRPLADTKAGLPGVRIVDCMTADGEHNASLYVYADAEDGHLVIEISAGWGRVEVERGGVREPV